MREGRIRRPPPPKKPPVPPEKAETVRRLLQSLLEEGEAAARDLSGEAHVSEKEVYAHLDHLRRSLQREGRRLEITPASCRSCGFVFAKRERLTPPGRCPVCRSEQIAEPLFFIPAK